MSNKLKDLREQMHMSQEEMAQELGVARSNISRMENDTLNIGNDLLVRLSLFFDTTTDEILGLPDPSIKNIDQLFQTQKLIMSDSSFTERYNKLDSSKKFILQLMLQYFISN